MSTIIALVTFHAALLAVLLMPMSIAAEERGEYANAHQLRSCALALVLVLAIAQAPQFGIPLIGRVALAAVGTAALVYRLRHHPI